VQNYGFELQELYDLFFFSKMFIKMAKLNGEKLQTGLYKDGHNWTLHTLCRSRIEPSAMRLTRGSFVFDVDSFSVY
jgi:hypothetical protein